MLPFPVTVPVLYLRGDRDPGALQGYVAGLRAAGFSILRNLTGGVIPDAGHFLP